MPFQCPFCGATIPADDVNVSTDLALCRTCGKPSKFSELVEGSGADRSQAPDSLPGAWAQEMPDGFRVGASTRSWGALFIIPFTCMWGGISLGGIYGEQVKRGHFNLFSSLFGLPFLIGSCVLVSVCAMKVAGKVDLILTREQLTIFTGIGPIGWSRSFRRADFDSVRDGVNRWGGGNSWNNRQHAIVLQGKRLVTFGSLLSDERRYFVLKFLQRMLMQRRVASAGRLGSPR